MSLAKMNRLAKIVTVERLRESVRYNHETGEFVWLVRPESHFRNDGDAARWNGKYAGNRAFTSACPRGYLRGCLDGCNLYAHRAAIALVTGEWPNDEVDHINRDKSDNRFRNLRLVSHRENRLNTDDCDRAAERRAALPKPQVKRTLPGIRRSASMKWESRLKRGGKETYIGTFACFAQAIKARRSAL